VSVGQEVGWQVLDPEGNIVEWGTVTIAEMTGSTAEMMDQEEQ
jgi:hypothetical protein